MHEKIEHPSEFHSEDGSNFIVTVEQAHDRTWSVYVVISTPFAGLDPIGQEDHHKLTPEEAKAAGFQMARQAIAARAKQS